MSHDESIPKGYWKDAAGALIPVDKIKPIDKDRHALVTLIADQSRQLSAAIRSYKAAQFAAIEEFLERSASSYDAKLGGKKGNLTLTTFDGKYKVIRAVSENLVFDERLQVAKSLIDECVHLWAKGANRNIQALVNHAFQVDTEGRVSTARVLSLRRLEIADEKWGQAMKAIADSMKVASSKTYIRVYERNDDSGEYIAIPLDVSAA